MMSYLTVHLLLLRLVLLLPHLRGRC